MFHFYFVIPLFIVIVDLEDIFSVSWLVLDYFSYSVLEIELLESDFIDIGVNIYSEFDNSYYWISVIDDLGDQSRLIW